MQGARSGLVDTATQPYLADLELASAGAGCALAMPRRYGVRAEEGVPVDGFSFFFSLFLFSFCFRLRLRGVVLFPAHQPPPSTPTLATRHVKRNRYPHARPLAAARRSHATKPSRLQPTHMYTHIIPIRSPAIHIILNARFTHPSVSGLWRRALRPRRQFHIITRLRKRDSREPRTSVPRSTPQREDERECAIVGHIRPKR